MDTSAAALMHDIGEILDDFKADMIESAQGLNCPPFTDHMKFSVQDIEEKTDNLIKEIKGLFSSSYSFNK